MAAPSPETEDLYGLVVQPPGKPQQVVTRYLKMILNFRYGVGVKVAHSLVEGCSVVQRNPACIVCTFVVQDEEISSSSILETLSQKGHIPLLLFLPDRLVNAHRPLYERFPLLAIGAWERAFNGTSASIREMIDRAFQAAHLDVLLSGAASLSYTELQKMVERRIRNLSTLPTLPQIVLQIMRLVEDPRTTIEDMEKVITSDPSMVWKLLEVVKSPVFAGRRRREWTLREIIVRLGMRKVGAIAQQIKLMNSFVKPDRGPLDLGRFWKHSLGCAMIADRLCASQRFAFAQKITFDEYWIGGVLHDIGKLVLGVFFPEHFEQVQNALSARDRVVGDFCQAETRIGYPGLHEEVARLLLLKADAGPRLVEAVGAHHAQREPSSDLVCLLHLADNLSKDLGLGYREDESGRYSRTVLRKLELTHQDLQEMAASLGDSIAAEVEDLARRSTAPPAGEDRPLAGRLPSQEEKERPPQPGPPARPLPEHPADRLVLLFALLDQLTEALRQAPALPREQREDLLVDVETVRTQFRKNEPNRTVVFAVLDSLSRLACCGDLVTRLERLLSEDLGQ